MKKIVFIVLGMFLFSSCAVFPGQTSYQTKNLTKFNKKKHRGALITKNRPSKQGSLNHPSVRKEDKRWQMQKMRFGN
jgi:hypothetical protein